MATSSRQIQEISTTKGVLHYYQDWERTEGGIVMQDAQTINLYHHLAYECNAVKDECGVFIDFDGKDIERGKLHLIEIGKLKDGEEMTSSNGVYGTEAAIEKYREHFLTLPQRIRTECDPQEVYFFEYNNYECMFDYNGDRDAIEIIIENWGADVAKGIKRFDGYLTVEQVANNKWL